MILSNILYRTLFIKSSDYGTAFTIPVGTKEYLVTAKHLVDVVDGKVTLQIFKDKAWHEFTLCVVGCGKNEVDIGVMEFADVPDGREPNVRPMMDGVAIGQDVYFTGFPYKMHVDIENLMGGLPLSFAKKGMLSAMSARQGEVHTLYVDAISNEGFSGGPLFFYHAVGKELPELRIAGVVSKFRTEYETVLDDKGEPTDMTVAYNTGFLIAYGIQHALDLIERHQDK
jgi:hypothetical protein